MEDREKCEIGGFGVCQNLKNYCPFGYNHTLCGGPNETACCIRKLCFKNFNETN